MDFPREADVTPEYEDLVYEAASRGDAAGIRALFARSKPGWPQQKTWRHPLVLASRSGCSDAVQALVDCGVRVDSEASEDGRTALHVAAWEGNLHGVQMLAAAGADITARDRKGHDALRLAASAGHCQVVQALLAAGCDVNSRCSAKGATALHEAARKGNTAVIDALAAAGADCAAADRKGQSPLAWAARAGRTKAVQRLLELGAPVDATVLVAAAACASSKPLKVLLPEVGPNLCSLPGVEDTVAAAASKGRHENVRFLLDAGLPVNARDSQGHTRLTGAATSRLKQAAVVIRTLLAAGLAVDERDSQGRTALMCAAASPSEQASEIVRTLLAAGAGVDERDSNGCTALMCAAQNYDAGPDMIEVLAAAGPSINARDNRGRTALHVFQELWMRRRPAAFHALLEAGADINAGDNEGVAPLLAALKDTDIQAARLYIEAGADLEAADKWGNTPGFLGTVKLVGPIRQELQSRGAPGALLGPLQRFFTAAAYGKVMEMLEVACAPPPKGVDINATGGTGVHCTHLLASYVSKKQHTRQELQCLDLARLLAAGADVAAASRAYPSPLDLMLFKNGLSWLQWGGNVSAIA